MGEGDGLGCLGDGDRHPRRRCTEIVRIARLTDRHGAGAGGQDRDGALGDGADRWGACGVGQRTVARAAESTEGDRDGGGGVVGAARGLGHDGQRRLARLTDREADRGGGGGVVVARPRLARGDRAGAGGKDRDAAPRNGAALRGGAGEADGEAGAARGTDRERRAAIRLRRWGGDGDRLRRLRDGDRDRIAGGGEMIRVARLGGADRTGAGTQDGDGAPRHGADTQRVARIGDGAAPRAAAARQRQRCGRRGAIGRTGRRRHGGERRLTRFIDRDAARHARGGAVVARARLACRNRAGAGGKDRDAAPRDGADARCAGGKADGKAGAARGTEGDRTGAIGRRIRLGEGDGLGCLGDGDRLRHSHLVPSPIPWLICHCNTCSCAQNLQTRTTHGANQRGIRAEFHLQT